MPYPIGTCITCGEQPEPERSRCGPCLAKRRRKDRALRKARRAQGLCITCGTRAKAERRYCTRHLAYYAARVALK